MRRSPLLRAGLLALAGTAGVGLVLVGGGLVWLTTPSGTAWAKDRLLAAVNAGMPGTVAIEALTMRLPGELSARGLSLASPRGRPLVTVGSVSLRLRPRRLQDRHIPQGRRVCPRCIQGQRPAGQAAHPTSVVLVAPASP